MRYPLRIIDSSVTGRLKAFNLIPLPAPGWKGIFLILLVLTQSAIPVEAKKKHRRKSLKPIQIRNITVDVRNIFDPAVPGENNWLFRLANKLHIATKPSVIRRELLVYPGDWTDLERLAESERNLRALSFIKAAEIDQIQAPDGRVDLRVRTQDSWTTQPQFNIASQGNQTTYSAGFEELNLLGYGKDLSYFYSKNIDGISHQIGYSDPLFLNTRMNLISSFQETATGNAQNLNLSYPFYSFTTRQAGGVVMNRSTGLQRVYENGQQISQYDQSQFNLDPFYGLWVNNDPLNVVRTQINYRYTENIITPQGSTLPGTLPADKALSGPILSTSFLQSDFIKETFADKTGRIEDFNLGHQAYAGVGIVERTLGATENSVPFAVNDAFGFGGNGDGFGLVSYGTSSRYRLDTEGETGGRLFNTLYFANFNYYRHILEDEFPMTGVIHLESAYLQNPDNDDVLSLGGNSGLRGYPNNSFTGNKSLLLNVEDRFYSSQEFLHLAYMGGAVCLDAGQVQPLGNGYDRKDWHADLGLGMRFGISRSAAGTVFRIDLAYAVGPVQQSNRWILSISSSQGFSQTANTYSNFPNPTTTQ
jgi:outer membrane protein assembly factor BamA